MKTFKTGTPVRFIQPVIEGVIVGGRLSEAGDTVDYVVAYTLPSGEMYARPLSGEELELLEGEEADRVLAQHEAHLDAEAAKRQREKDIAAMHNAEHEHEAQKAGLSVKDYLTKKGEEQS